MAFDNPPLVSVVMPVFNGERCVLDGINSVRSQLYQNWELIVIDDGSTDNTWSLLVDIASIDKRIKVIKRTTEIKGAPGCRNIGLSQSTGHYVIFLDADDLLLPYCISQRVDAMTKLPELDFGVFLQGIRSQKKWIDNKIFNIKERNRLSLIRYFIQFRIPWQTTAPMWRNEYLRELGGFNTNYKRMEDPDLHVRALFETEKFMCFFDLPFDCYYSVNFFNKTGTDISDFAVADALIFYATVSNYLSSFSDFTDHDKRKYISDGILYLFRFHAIKNYQRYRSTMKAISGCLANKKLISNRLKWKLFLIDFMYSKPNWGIITSLAKKIVNRIAFYKVKKYVIE